MRSPSSNHSFFLLFLAVLAQVAHNLDYSDLEAMDISCPERDKCAGYRFNRNFMDRNCECDYACRTYRDCCIDAQRRRSSSRAQQLSNIICLNYGEGRHTGVYVVSRCSANWNGPQQVRQKCEGPTDFSDPMSAAPVTSVAQSVTYKNLFCAECNNAHMQSLKTFQFKLSCDGLDDISQAQIMGDLFYDQQRATWGINRPGDGGDKNFVECDIIFYVPDYINSTVRFCRANVISTCASDWTRPSVRQMCEEYMAVVYGIDHAYRNPHCAICNHKTVADIACKTSWSSRRRMFFPDLVDVNPGDGDQVGVTKKVIPQCPSLHKYDPFAKKCRKMQCAIPSYELVDGKCVPPGS
uniref:Putative secrin-like G-Protein coupled receptor n=1 Tax=Cupiennius salei TaxID=6928 RepID=T1E1S0_CUPSA